MRKDNRADPVALTMGIAEQKFSDNLQADFDLKFQRLRHPYDQEARAQLADEIFWRHCPSTPPGSFERAALLLKILEIFYPTQQVTHAYLENLQALLGNRQALTEPGKVVLGVGTGRCGSTSLTMAFRSLDGALATHENPPMIFWQPLPEQVKFHMERLAILIRYFPFVFDASHWWLNVVDIFFQRFPEGRIVGLHRNTESCVNSFLRIKGTGLGTSNHWAAPGDSRWALTTWDPTYPSFAAPPTLGSDPIRVKRTQIQWYVDSYNERLRELARAQPDRIVLICMDELTQSRTANTLSKFVGGRVVVPAVRHNSSGSTALESVARQQHFRI